MNCTKDVILKDKNILYYFSFLKWDTDFFGKNSYILNLEKSNLKPSAKIRSLIQERLNNSFITAKIDLCSNKGLLVFLQNLGFRYIGTEVLLKYDDSFQLKKRAVNKIKVYEIKNNKGLPYADLGSVFNFSRFHLDVNISKAKADQLWEEYIKNFKPSPLNHMYIAKYNGLVAGAILVNIDKPETKATVYFVSVIESYRKMGVGTALAQYLIRSLKKYELITETQVNNIYALNFYIKNGFSIVENTKTILHKWS